MVQAGAGQIKVTWANGQNLLTDLVIIGVGVAPRSQLAKEAGLKLGVRGAVAVDRRQRTSDPAIFSGGDCAEAYHLLLKRNVYLPLALGANRQGRIIGDNLTGGSSEFPGVLGTAVTKVFDLTAARTGLGFKEAQAEGFDPLKVVSTANSRAGYYPGGGPVTTVLVVDRPTRRILGVHMVGRDGVAQRLDTWVTALTGGLTLEEVAGLDLAYAPPFSPVWGPVLIAAQVALKKLGGDD
jgi:NADPH-dependent 2,4-dienoyl-CoA reductase/sulfur reductase-like enzyme